MLHEHAFNQQKMNFLLYIEGKCTFLVWGNYTYRKKNHEKGLCQHANHFFYNLQHMKFKDMKKVLKEFRMLFKEVI